MTTPTFDPEVQALLEEIVADPGSILLRVSQARLSRWIDSREPSVSASEPLLTRAERHLLLEYRESVAQMLYTASLRRMFEAPSWKSMLHRRPTLETKVEIATDEVWQEQVTRELRLSRPVTTGRIGLELLRRSASRGDEERPSAVELAAASLRLVPRDEARISLSLALGFEGQFNSAVRAAESVLTHQPSSQNASIAQEQVAFLLFEKGSIAAARELYGAASFLTDNRPAPAMAWFNLSLQENNETAALEAAHRLGEVIAIDHPLIQEHIDIWEGRKRAGLFHPDARSIQLARRLEERLPSVAGRITHVFS